MPRYIDADKADIILHKLLHTVQQEKISATSERERKRKSDIAAGIVLAIAALRDMLSADIWAETCGYKE